MIATNQKKESKKPIGKLLMEKGLITESHIQLALQEQKITKEKLGEVLERLTFVTQYDVATTISEQEGIPYQDLDEIVPQEKVLKMFNKRICLNNVFLPLSIEERTIKVATGDVWKPNLSQLIIRHTGLQLQFVLAERNKIINAINTHYYFLEHPVQTLIQNEINMLVHDEDMVRGMDDLLKYLFHYAVKMRTTDIHIRPMERSINIAFRLDGVLTTVLSLPPQVKRIVSSIKMKAEMDIAEQRLPQDGRFSASILNNEYDFRVSTIVSPYGENVVLRLLPKASSIIGMGQLGFFDEDVSKVENMFDEPFGMVLLTGPTGSGKTTTLYAGVRSLDLLAKNVLTVENPIEYNVPLIRQTQVNEKAGYTFSNAIRNFLRHDPDIMLIGEIRDSETAATAISASVTGHLVLSTLHTNTAIGAIPRLRDLGIRSFLLADSLLGVVSQRLVRRICSNCKEEYEASYSEKKYLGEPDLTTLYRGKGCEVCNDRGYLGRTLVYEILTVDETIASLIDQEVEMKDIAEAAKSSGFIDTFNVAVRKVKEGITTVDEIVRVLGSVRRVG